MEDDIGKTLQVDRRRSERTGENSGAIPACAEETAQQIAGVVAAIQAHDITRQQIEHVQQSLGIDRSENHRR